MRTKSVIVLGNLSEGFIFVGPFETHDEAAAHVAANSNELSWIATLHSPEEAEAKLRGA